MRRLTISFSEASDDLELDGPNSFRCRIDSFLLDNRGVVSAERIEQMVDDIGWIHVVSDCYQKQRRKTDL